MGYPNNMVILLGKMVMNHEIDIELRTILSDKSKLNWSKLKR
jgi:hypothetical protein